MISQLQTMKDQSAISPSNLSANRSFTFTLPSTNQNGSLSSANQSGECDIIETVHSLSDPSGQCLIEADFVIEEGYEDEVPVAIAYPAQVALNENECALCGCEMDTNRTDLMAHSLNTITSALFSSASAPGDSSAKSHSRSAGIACNSCQKVPSDSVQTALKFDTS